MKSYPGDRHDWFLARTYNIPPSVDALPVTTLPGAKSKTDCSFRSTSGGLWAQGQSAVHVVPRAQLLHHFTPAQTACPTLSQRWMQASRGCGVQSGQRATRGAFFRDSRCHGMLPKKGKVSKDARAAASRLRLVIRRPVSVTIRIAGAGDFSLLVDDDFPR